ncbi:DUF4232 domain-containing protein [Streptomyces odonnellii]|uniref:DUF4232 domain-containing protein n=1 Tax=Streptomyces odonnellii TaxID=1417980 RepID=UPI000697BBF6|nr:DUF4232 domain-containing protein [Streptomyces odonnellii]
MSDLFHGSRTPAGEAAGRRPVRSRRAARGAAVAVAVIALGFGTAACGGGADTVSGPGASGAGTVPRTGGTEVTSAAPGTPPASMSPVPTDSVPTDPDRPVPSAPDSSPVPSASSAPSALSASRCTADRLGLSLSAPDAGAGNIRYDLRLINKGRDACVLLGFPGVSLLAGDGAMIGRPATREGERLPAVRLGPGGSADVTLHTLNRGINGTSCWPAPALLRIYPPGSRDAMTLRTESPVVCGGTFTTTAVRPG